MPSSLSSSPASLTNTLTYFFVVCLLSIAFLVFLNASASFVITDVIGIEPRQRRGNHHVGGGGSGGGSGGSGTGRGRGREGDHGAGGAVGGNKDGAGGLLHAGRRTGNVGDMVGTLGFVDELVALVACPLWGMLSDRVGGRAVCVAGYVAVALALVCSVQAADVYPQLLLARVLFSVGGAATSTMVTAILPSIAYGGREPAQRDNAGRSTRPTIASDITGTQHSSSPSLSSELTITPARLMARTQSQPTTVAKRDEEQPVRSAPVPSSLVPKSVSASRLAGFVGFATACGALLALVVFLPLPARFAALLGVTAAQAVTYSYYVVAAVALLAAGASFFGLRNLGEQRLGKDVAGGEGERGETDAVAIPRRSPYAAVEGSDADFMTRLGTPVVRYVQVLGDAAALGFKDSHIGLGYVGGFVARASSVGISLFIPLFVNAYFISSGLCHGGPSKGTQEMKKECRRAYILAAELTGVSQLVALIFAPVFGYVSDSYRTYNVPLLAASLAGIIGYLSFAALNNPEVGFGGGGSSSGGSEHGFGLVYGYGHNHNHDHKGDGATSGRGRGSPAVFLIVALLGFSQIGCIVCSLGLLSRGIIGGQPGREERDAAASGYSSQEDLLDADEYYDEGIGGGASSGGAGASGRRHYRSHNGLATSAGTPGASAAAAAASLVASTPDETTRLLAAANDHADNDNDGNDDHYSGQQQQQQQQQPPPPPPQRYYGSQSPTAVGSHPRPHSSASSSMSLSASASASAAASPTRFAGAGQHHHRYPNPYQHHLSPRSARPSLAPHRHPSSSSSASASAAALRLAAAAAAPSPPLPPPPPSPPPHHPTPSYQQPYGEENEEVEVEGGEGGVEGRSGDGHQHQHHHLPHKGAIAGVYSLAGGAGILLLTKAGGALFDRVRPAAPFVLLALFNGALFAVAAAVDARRLFVAARLAREGRQQQEEQQQQQQR